MASWLLCFWSAAGSPHRRPRLARVLRDPVGRGLPGGAHPRHEWSSQNYLSELYVRAEACRGIIDRLLFQAVSAEIVVVFRDRLHRRGARFQPCGTGLPSFPGGMLAALRRYPSPEKPRLLRREKSTVGHWSVAAASHSIARRNVVAGAQDFLDPSVLNHESTSLVGTTLQNQSPMLRSVPFRISSLYVAHASSTSTTAKPWSKAPRTVASTH